MTSNQKDSADQKKKKKKISKMKSQPTEWEKISANHIFENGLILKIYF